MMKRAITALAAAAALWSGAAAAAPMLVTIEGDFNDDPVWSHWQVQIRYDSDLGVVDMAPDLSRFTWDQSLGTPSPVSSVQGFVVPLTDPPPTYHFLFTDPTSVTFGRGSTFDRFQVAGPGWSVDLGEIPLLGPDHPTDYRFDTPWSRPMMEYGSWDIGIETGLPHVHGVVSVERLTVPEPATWGLMILGFGMAGAVLRRRRHLVVARAGHPVG